MGYILNYTGDEINSLLNKTNNITKNVSQWLNDADYIDRATINEKEDNLKNQINELNTIITTLEENLSSLENIQMELNTNLNIVSERDYIVEQGTSGIWTYRKWNSGIAECWGRYTSSVNVTVNTAYGNCYIANNNPITPPNFPTNLFNSIPYINVSYVQADPGTWFDCCWVTGGLGTVTSSSPGKYTISSGKAVGTIGHPVIAIQAKGRWK